MIQRWSRPFVTAVGFGIALLLQSVWCIELFSAPDRLEAPRRDWVQFPRTAERVLAVDSLPVYPVGFEDDGRPDFDDGIFFFYPPTVAVLTLPLAFVPRLASFAILVAVVAGGTLLAALILLASLGKDRGWWPAGIFSFAGSAPWNVALYLGHLSSLLVLAPALAIRSVGKGRPFLGGVALSLLMAKPNLGVAFFLLVLASRRRALIGGFLTGTGLWVLISIPLGLSLWRDWGLTMLAFQPVVTDLTPSWKQVTLFSSLQSLLGDMGPDHLANFAWASLSIPIAAWTAAIWWRSGHSRTDFPRLLGLGVLSVLAVNPYAYYYDAVLLVVPAFVLWTTGPGHTMVRRVCWASLGFIFFWHHAQCWVFKDQAPALVGVGVTVWAIAELVGLSILDPSQGSGTQGNPNESLLEARA